MEKRFLTKRFEGVLFEGIAWEGAMINGSFREAKRQPLRSNILEVVFKKWQLLVGESVNMCWMILEVWG